MYDDVRWVSALQAELDSLDGSAPIELVRAPDLYGFELLQGGAAHVVIAPVVRPTAARRTVHLFDDELVGVVSCDHPLAERDALAPADFDGALRGVQHHTRSGFRERALPRPEPGGTQGDPSGRVDDCDPRSRGDKRSDHDPVPQRGSRSQWCPTASTRSSAAGALVHVGERRRTRSDGGDDNRPAGCMVVETGFESSHEISGATGYSVTCCGVRRRVRWAPTLKLDRSGERRRWRPTAATIVIAPARARR